MKEKNIFCLLNEVCSTVGSIFFLLMTVICVMQVVARYCFHSAMAWPEEASRFLFIWLSYLGVAYSTYARDHLKVDIIFTVVNRPVKKFLLILGEVVTFVFMIFLAYYGIVMLDIVIESEEIALSLPVPLWIVWFSIPFTFAISGIYCIRNIYNYIVKKEN